MAIQHGRNTALLMQFEDTFRVAPTPAATSMKFSPGLQIQETVGLLDDPTITSQALADKRDCNDEAWTLSVPAILCLNDVGYWLKLMLGDPSTSGAGPYTHTYSMDLTERPSALVELGYLSANKHRRWFGVKGQSMRWGVRENDQDLSIELMAAVEQTDPRPSSAFDAAPTRLAKNRACSKGGQISDNGDTLGAVISSTIEIANDHEGMHLADGASGYGVIPLGAPTISGTLRAMIWDGSLMDHAEGRVSRSLTLVSHSADGAHSLTCNLPHVEFDRPQHSVPSSRGIVMDIGWRAHDGPTQPTFVLVNDVSGY